MARNEPTRVVGNLPDLTKPGDAQSLIYKAISVQRPVVMEYLKSVRRDKPDATPADILRELDRRYVTTVTLASTGVGASAAIPAVGIPLALGLGVADLLFFYETSALYVLAATELHGIEVRDAERARSLVFGMLLGEKSQSKVTALVLEASGAGGVNRARAVAKGTVGKAMPKGWGEVLTQQLPDSALAPLATVLARQALKAGSKVVPRTLGKAVPFGVGAIVGGVGSFTFGRDVVKAARLAFPTAPTEFPPSLLDFQKQAPTAAGAAESAEDPQIARSSRAVKAMQSVTTHASNLRDDAWGGGKSVVGRLRSAGSRLRGRGDKPTP